MSTQINCKITYLTSRKYDFVLQNNPYIDDFLYYEELPQNLEYDIVIDLHKNPKTTLLRQKIKGRWITYHKRNIDKWLFTSFKWNRLESEHLIDRYFKTLTILNVKNDNEGLNYHADIPPSIMLPSTYDVVNCGGTYFTKRIPKQKVNEIILHSRYPVLLVGGVDVDPDLIEIRSTDKVINLIGSISFNESAYVVKQANEVWTSDSALMHVAAAFHKKINVLWGNTHKSFGMYPYLPPNAGSVHHFEVKLSCRPCSKIGFESCPKGHFKCMHDQSINSSGS